MLSESIIWKLRNSELAQIFMFCVEGTCIAIVFFLPNFHTTDSLLVIAKSSWQFSKVMSALIWFFFIPFHFLQKASEWKCEQKVFLALMLLMVFFLKTKNEMWCFWCDSRRLVSFDDEKLLWRKLRRYFWKVTQSIVGWSVKVI